MAKKKKLSDKIYGYLTKNKKIVVVIILVGFIASMGAIVSFFKNTSEPQEDICDPYRLIKVYEELKLNNKSVDICKNNVTRFYYKKCGFTLAAYQFDQCDVFTTITINPESKNFGDYFLVYPFWNKSGEDYYFFDLNLENKNRASVYVTSDKKLIWLISEDDGTKYELSLDVSDWNAKEWAVIVFGYDHPNLYLLYRNLNNLTKRGKIEKNIPNLEVTGGVGIANWGSDLQEKNQANAVISMVEKKDLLNYSSWVWSYLK